MPRYPIERAGARAAASPVGGRLRIRDPEDRAAAKPGDDHLLSNAVRSIKRPVRRAAVDIDRLVGAPLRRLAIFMSTWLRQVAERRVLRRLDDHMLKDIGVSRGDLQRRWYDIGQVSVRPAGRLRADSDSAAT
jgi:uncharacterized protein YjiS (DUF1127 family)